MVEEIVPSTVRPLLAMIPRGSTPETVRTHTSTNLAGPLEEVRTMFLKVRESLSQLEHIAQRTFNSRRWKLGNILRLAGKKLNSSRNGTLGAKDYDEAKMRLVKSLERMEIKLQKLAGKIAPRHLKQHGQPEVEVRDSGSKDEDR